MIYTCPVCAYGAMEDPPIDYNICPCCGTEFGYTDHVRSYLDLRNAWLRNGAQWFSPVDVPPQGWNPYAQLDAAGYEYGTSPRNSLSEITIAIVRALPYSTGV